MVTRGTGKSGLLSLNPSTGEILWKFTTEGEVMPTPAFYKGLVYIVTGDRHLYAVKFFAVDLDERQIMWEKELDELDYGLDDVPPVVSDTGLVYTTGVKATSQPVSLREMYDMGGVIAAYKQAIKMSVGKLINKQAEVEYEHYIYAFDSNNGETIWKESLGKGQMVSNNKSGAPMLYKGKVFVGSPITKTFYSYNSKDGKMLWSYESNVNKAPPVAKNYVVYFTDTKGIVYAFSTNFGELLGSKMVGGKLAPSGPLIINDQLIVGSQNSNLYTLPTKNILESNDKIKNNNIGQKSFFSYLFFVYIMPIVFVVLGAILVFYILKKIWRSAH